MASVSQTTRYVLNVSETELNILQYAVEHYRRLCADNTNAQHHADAVFALEQDLNID